MRTPWRVRMSAIGFSGELTVIDCSIQVNYFIGRKAIDALMESKLKEKLEINSRSQASYLMEELLAYKFFHRARKIAMEVKSKKKVIASDNLSFS